MAKVNHLGCIADITLFFGINVTIQMESGIIEQNRFIKYIVYVLIELLKYWIYLA